MQRRFAFASVGLTIVLALCTSYLSAQSLLKTGDSLAVCGDSITEQKLYTVFMEDYLLMCQPTKVRTTQFGWSGERAPGFAARMENDCLVIKPTIATTCYGMNDGGYGATTQAIEQTYRGGMTEIATKFKGAGTRVVLGSSGCVDSETFRKDPKAAEIYNATLARLRDVAREVAQAQGVAFADVYTPMFETVAKAKAKYGAAYPVCGGDGVHPASNGHLIMAYAFLKTLGCDGDIGTITVDLKADKATASDGHAVKSCAKGVVTLESTRYPFCFSGKPEDPNATSGIIAFFPFNDDLNRFKLVVTNTNADKIKVTWGNTTKEFEAAQLAKGVNLAAEFPVENPFAQAFAQIDAAVRNKQNLETTIFKTLIHNVPSYVQFAPDGKEHFAQFVSAAVACHADLSAATGALVKPVTHTIKIEPVEFGAN